MQNLFGPRQALFMQQVKTQLFTFGAHIHLDGNRHETEADYTFPERPGHTLPPDGSGIRCFSLILNPAECSSHKK
jgi:hypothetical protein